MIELYTHPMSPCAQKVRLVLAEKGLVWQARHVDLPNKENLQPWYLALNPLGVVPTLVEDGRPVIESSIICEYLEDRYPQVPLRPREPYAVATMRLWMKRVDNKLHPACGTLQWPLVMRPGLMKLSEAERTRLLEQVVERERRERQKRLVQFGLDAPDVALAVRTYTDTIDDMEAALAGREWIAGDTPSLADFALAPYFQTLYQFGWTALYERDRPRVSAWYARIRARDAYRRAVAEDFPPPVLEDLRARGAEAWPRLERHLAAA